MSNIMKTIRFPGDNEPREIVDAAVRERVNELSEDISALDEKVSKLPAQEAVVVDAEMSDVSKNPVQNKVIKAYVDSAISGSWLEVY